MSNEKKYEDQEYINLVSDILEHDEFNKTKEIVHHGLNRFDHSMRVSYYAYKITKLLKLDYKGVARAGLLHDFFFVDNSDVDRTKRLDVLINHPKYALANAKRYFELSDKEANIIESHMFPISLKTPKYLESWIVDMIDNVVAVTEAIYVNQKHLKIAANFLMLILINYLR